MKTTIDRAKRNNCSKSYSFFLYLFLIVFSLILILMMANSLHWRMEHDTPLLHYSAMLMDKYEQVPYRDFFETSMPGSFLFHYLIVKVVWYSDQAFQIVNLVFFCALSLVTLAIMRKYHPLSAWLSIIIFGLIYFGKGQTMTLQRDYIGILPVALAFLIDLNSQSLPNENMRDFSIGFLFGAASLIKPHLAIGLSIFILLSIMDFVKTTNKNIWIILRKMLNFGISFLIPIGITLLWLAQKQALEPFMEMFTQYLPLHTALNGQHVVLDTNARMSYLFLFALRLGGYPILFFLALFAGLLLRRKKTAYQRNAITITLALLLYAIYPVIGGKFWAYHYMPLAYFGSLGVGLAFFCLSNHTFKKQRLLCIKDCMAIILFALLAVQVKMPGLISTTLSELQSQEAQAPNKGRVDELVSWIQNNADQGDLIQPLDWTGGSIHALLITQTRIATRFLYDYHFYHHVSNPYIQQLRSEFIKQLAENQPRYIIDVKTQTPSISGLDTSINFPELDNFLKEQYELVFTGDGYQIYESVFSSVI